MGGKCTFIIALSRANVKMVFRSGSTWIWAGHAWAWNSTDAFCAGGGASRAANRRVSGHSFDPVREPQAKGSPANRLYFDGFEGRPASRAWASRESRSNSV